LCCGPCSWPLSLANISSVFNAESIPVGLVDQRAGLRLQVHCRRTQEPSRTPLAGQRSRRRRWRRSCASGEGRARTGQALAVATAVLFLVINWRSSFRRRWSGGEQIVQRRLISNYRRQNNQDTWSVLRQNSGRQKICFWDNWDRFRILVSSK